MPAREPVFLNSLPILKPEFAWTGSSSPDPDLGRQELFAEDFLMVRTFVVCLLSLLVMQAATPQLHVRGEITGGQGVPPGDLTVDLLDLRNRSIGRAPVFANGSFEFRQVPAGEYNVLVTFNGTVLLRTMISVRDLTAFVNLRLQDQTAARPASESISVRRLTHKVPRKALKEFNRAKKAERAGDAAQAIDHLANAVSIDPDSLRRIRPWGPST